MRIIARLDIKNKFVIKGINLEGLRKIGNPVDIAKDYYKNGIDEIILIDCVASLYDRNNLFDVIEQITKSIFIPITLGGGIRKIQDIDNALAAGADKIAINTFATENPNFIKEAVNIFGSSTIMSYIEAKNIGDNMWEVYKNYGRDKTNIDLIEWINKVQNLGCGEIMLTSVDNEGTQNGFDIDLINSVYDKINVPLIISGGCGSIDHVKKIKDNFPDTDVGIASSLHYKKIEINKLKEI